jgi:hypothetical protein
VTKPCRSGLTILGLGVGLALLAGVGSARPRAQVADEGPIASQSPGVRIVRGFDRLGRPALILTNLDDEGNRLIAAEEPERTPAPGSPAEPGPGACAPQSPGREGDPGSSSDRRDGGDGAPIIVINIENQAPPPPPQEAGGPSWLVPVVGFGGLPGPFHYPARQPFLGYGPGIASPSWFGGLGLNAGNRYGLGGARDCGEGYDCLFAPSSSRP